MKRLLKVLYYFSFIVYLFALIAILFLKGRGYSGGLSMVNYIRYYSNFVPFKTISFYIQSAIKGSINADIPIKNLLGNLLLFLPMGFYLPYCFKKLYLFRNYIISIAIILIGIEIGQLLLRRGSFDIDDFILNILGAMIGYAIGKIKIVKRILQYIS